MFKMKAMGIKAKVRAACVILGSILLFSSIISIFEYSNMNRYVTRVLSENIESINSSKDLLEAAEGYNLQLMYIINGLPEDVNEIDKGDITLKFSNLHRKFDGNVPSSSVDSVIFAYTAYMQVAREAGTVWNGDLWQRREWFFNRLQPVYIKLRGYVQELTFVSQDALIDNSKSLQDNFYRSMVPSSASLILILLLVLLFNYYLNYYLINPFLKVSKGITDYRKFNKEYNVNVDSEDEISELNNAARDLIDLNESYKRQLKRNS